MKKPGEKKKEKGPQAAKEKQKPIAYVNWEIRDADGNVAIRSSKGFAIFDNEHLTIEERALVDLAISNDGSAKVDAELRIIVAQEKPEIKTDGIKLKD